MVRAFTSQQQTMQKTRSFQFKRMFEIPRHLQNSTFENGQDGEGDGDTAQLLSPKTTPEGGPVETQGMWGPNRDKGVASGADEGEKMKSPKSKRPSDMEMMKERFSKSLSFRLRILTTTARSARSSCSAASKKMKEKQELRHPYNWKSQVSITDAS